MNTFGRPPLVQGRLPIKISICCSTCGLHLPKSTQLPYSKSNSRWRQTPPIGKVLPPENPQRNPMELPGGVRFYAHCIGCSATIEIEQTPDRNHLIASGATLTPPVLSNL